MTGHNFTYDRTQQVRVNHSNIPDGRNSGSSSRQQPSGYGDLLRGNSDPLIPKPNVKKFEGDPLDYWAFYNRFRCHVADWLPLKTKMSYLLQHCSPQVCDNIQHFADIHDGQYSYDLAWDELKRRYGQPHVIAQACEEKLLEFPKIERDVADRLNRLFVLMKRCCYSLADERVTSSLDSVTFLSAIVSKFPLDLKRKWVETTVQISNKFSRLATFKDLALFVEEQTRIANSVFGLKLFTHSSTKSDQSKKVKALTLDTVTSAEEKSPHKKYLHCAESHCVYQCKLFRSLDFQKRWELVRWYSLCKICLNDGHFAAKCTSGLKCKRRNCGSLWHNTILHPPEATKDKSRNYSGNNCDLNCNQPAAPVSVAKSLVIGCTSTITSKSTLTSAVFLCRLWRKDRSL